MTNESEFEQIFLDRSLDTAEDREPAKFKKPAKSIAQVLVELAIKEYEFWKSQDNHAYATIKTNGHLENWKLHSSEFKRHLINFYWNATNKIASDKHIKEAISILENRAIEGTEHRVYCRVAKHNETIFIDLGNRDWEVIKITAEGWTIVANPPVKFRRTSNTGELPRPQQKGNLDLLRSLCGCTDEGWTLIKGFIFDALKGDGPYLIFNVGGIQGSCKSTLCLLMRLLIDPIKKARLSALPRTAHDLAIDAVSEHCLAYDNVSFLPMWLSDALCRISTGSGVKVRALYTDAGQSILDSRNPVILNGIPDFAVAADLLDRSIVVAQPQLPTENRKEEKEIISRFEKMLPSVLGGVCDQLAIGLRDIQSVDIPLPRMADSIKWIVACFGSEEFLETYNSNREDAIDVSVDASPIARYVIDFVKSVGAFRGQPQELFEKIKIMAAGDNPKDFPGNAKVFVDRLKRDVPGLNKNGISWDQGKDGKCRKSNGKKILDLVYDEEKAKVLELLQIKSY